MIFTSEPTLDGGYAESIRRVELAMCTYGSRQTSVCMSTVAALRVLVDVKHVRPESSILLQSIWHSMSISG
jgi:hypothetical protein